jgi:hypothetical protein
LDEDDVTEIMERHVIKSKVVTRLIMPDHPVPTTVPVWDQRKTAAFSIGRIDTNRQYLDPLRQCTATLA